jgi:methionine biosynthesis protein MetW
MLENRPSPPLSHRKSAIRELSDRLAPERDSWVARNAFYYEEDERYMRFLVPEGLRVLDLGCGTGTLLAALKPSCGVGIDFSENMVAIAQTKYPHLEFQVGDVEDPDMIARLQGRFDVIVMSDTIGSLDDCESTLANLHRVCTRDTRLIIAYYSRIWVPILAMGRVLGLQMPHTPHNWLSTEDIRNLLSLADFQVIKREWRQLIPRRVFGLGPVINRYLAPIANHPPDLPEKIMWLPDQCSTSLMILHQPRSWCPAETNTGISKRP